MKRRSFLICCAAGLLLSGCSSGTGRLLADDPLVRSEALEAAAKSPEKNKKKIVAKMKKILLKKDRADRAYAAAALEDIGPAAADAVPELIQALKDEDADIAASAERTLKHLGASAPALAEALETSDPVLRARIGQVLAAQGPAAVPELVKNFGKGKRELALWSAGILGQMGPAAADAVPALARAAVSGDAAVAGQAAAALTAVGAPAGLWLGAALSSANPSSRAGAAKVLSTLTPPPAEAAGALASALEDTDAKVREHAAMALASYPGKAFASLPENVTAALIKASAANDAAAGWAKTALERAGRGPAAPKEKSVPDLIAALRSPDHEARVAAAAALGALGPAASEAIPGLWIAFKTKDCRQRASAARALAEINPRLKKYGAVTRAMKKVCPGKKPRLLKLPGLKTPVLIKPATGQLPVAP